VASLQGRVLARSFSRHRARLRLSELLHERAMLVELVGKAQAPRKGLVRPDRQVRLGKQVSFQRVH
jgi:hypothetical protein